MNTRSQCTLPWMFWISWCLLISLPGIAQEFLPVRFQSENEQIRILIGNDPVATYVYREEKILRPYFCDLRAPGGIPITRHHPPVEGVDRTDHDTMHPGLWMAFGDLSGSDFWRNQSRVEHVRFIQDPQDGATGTFTVENRYLSADQKEICREICRISFQSSLDEILVNWRSDFRSANNDITFGDQEEMGLGVRVATPMIVPNGGQIRNSHGQLDEKDVWGKIADWCEYSGMIDGHRVGILLIPSPRNFRPCWFHARDYGLLVANPFGRNAFTRGEKSNVEVKKGESFLLEYQIVLYRGTMDIPAHVQRYKDLF